MRVTSMCLCSPTLEEPITFGLRYTESQGQYIVRNIVGLDAEELIPKFYGTGLQTKSRFYDFGLKSRDIVMSLVLNPRFKLDESYSDIRDYLYRTISSTRTGMIELQFFSGATTVAKISGFITKFEVPYFTERPEVQITVRCDDPMFRAINPVIFEPEDLSSFNPIIIPDSISTAPHGFSMEVVFTAPSDTFLIQDDPTHPEWTFKVVPGGFGFIIGDQLYFCSEYANRHLYMVRGSVTTHLMDKIEPTSIWPTIFPGANVFQIVTLPKLDWVSFKYYAAYWGV